MSFVAEQKECPPPAKCSHHSDHKTEMAQLPVEMFVCVFSNLPTAVIVHRIGAVCKDWRAIVKDDDLWRLRSGLSELPPYFHSWFAYAQRQTIRDQALDHLYGRSGLPQNWRHGMQKLKVLIDARDDYALALCGWLYIVGIPEGSGMGVMMLQQSSHVTARAMCMLYGFGVPGDPKEAFRRLTTECNASDPHVQ
eukprot:TRINITY_DN1771_c0_g4_i1.p1 TRINITY_DN1771_c0_g4~~TRINITY_DN1771_c0_g4_i1.p1  ORF type:complete len:194 (+),score=27.93 TRINITY_DN1771_c0_g4_i1:38-619(+)